MPQLFLRSDVISSFISGVISDEVSDVMYVAMSGSMSSVILGVRCNLHCKVSVNVRCNVRYNASWLKVLSHNWGNLCVLHSPACMSFCLQLEEYLLVSSILMWMSFTWSRVRSQADNMERNPMLMIR